MLSIVIKQKISRFSHTRKVATLVGRAPCDVIMFVFVRARGRVFLVFKTYLELTYTKSIFALTLPRANATASAHVTDDDCDIYPHVVIHLLLYTRGNTLRKPPLVELFLFRKLRPPFLRCLLRVRGPTSKPYY